MRRSCITIGFVAGLSRMAFAGPGGPPAGAPILNQSYPQNGAVFNVSSGTISGQTTIKGPVIDGTLTPGTSRQIMTSNGPGQPWQWRTAVTTSGSTLGLGDLNNVTLTNPQINDELVFNGSFWVNAGEGVSFAFSIFSFSDGLPATIEASSGVWKSSGTMTFSANYSNGPPIGSTITFGGWASMLPLSSPFISTNSIANTNYPAPGGSLVFVLNAQKSNSIFANGVNITHTFPNDRYWGVSSVVNGSFVSTNVTVGLGNSDLVNSIPKTFTVTAGAGQYIVYSYPTRLGTASFSVGGFTGGFDPPQTLSVKNGSGYTENFFVYTSHNTNLGATTVVATTP